MVLNVHKKHKAYYLGTGRSGEGGMEAGGKGDYNYTYRYTVTTRMTSASVSYTHLTLPTMAVV